MIIAYYVQKNEQLCKLYAHILLKHMQIELMLLLLHGKLPKSVNKVKTLNQHDKRQRIPALLLILPPDAIMCQDEQQFAEGINDYDTACGCQSG